MLSFTADREQFVLAVARAAQGLHGDRLKMLLRAEQDQVKLTASDGDVTFTASADAAVDEPGSAVVPGKMLDGISRYFTGKEVLVTQGDGMLILQPWRSAFRIPSAPEKDYPSWSKPPEPFLELDGAEFGAALRKVIPAAGDADPVLRSVCAELQDNGKFTLVCTDKFCLAISVPDVRTASLSGGKSHARRALFPVTVMDRISRLAEGKLRLGWDEHLMSAEFPGLQVSARLIQGKYLDWLAILGKVRDDVTARAGRAELISLVKAAMLTASAGTVRVRFSPGEVTVSSAAEDGQCAGSADADYDGDPADFRLGGQMLLDGLAGCDDIVQMAFTEPLAPVLLIGGGGYRFLLKPRRELQGSV